MDMPFSQKQLGSHLKIPRAKVLLVARGKGFSLIIKHIKGRFVMHTQRDSVRIFTDLTRAAAFLRKFGVNSFTVLLDEDLLVEDDDFRGPLDDDDDDDDDGDFDDWPPRRPSQRHAP